MLLLAVRKRKNGQCYLISWGTTTYTGVIYIIYGVTPIMELHLHSSYHGEDWKATIYHTTKHI